MDVSGQRCDTGTYSSVPASRCVSSSVTQQVTVACGSSTSRKEVSWWCETGFVRGAFHQIVSWPRRAPGPVGKHRGGAADIGRERQARSEEHTSELQSLMRISYAVFCLKKKKQTKNSTQQPAKQETQR